MKNGITRRRLAVGSAAAGAAWLSGVRLGAAEFKTKLYRAQIVGKPSEKNLEPLKAGGFDGVETQAADVTPDEAAECRKSRNWLAVAAWQLQRSERRSVL